jgi:hypothetical protein
MGGHTSAAYTLRYPDQLEIPDLVADEIHGFLR